VSRVPHAFVFDVDGVLVDSEQVKMAAFAEACQQVWRLNDDELDAVRAYNSRQRGVPRRLKFEFVHRHLVMRGDSAGVVRVMDRYAELLAARLPACPLLPGVRAFLEQVPAQRFVVTAAPEDEVTELLVSQRLEQHFEALFASAAAKAAALRRIAAAVEGPVVFFGDAPADQAAAVASGVRFVAVNPNDHLRAGLTGSVADFSDQAAVLRLAGLSAAEVDLSATHSTRLPDALPTDLQPSSPQLRSMATRSPY
jgi:phosphoglycolate phosphatase-like HAD superfamily hydrolase